MFSHIITFVSGLIIGATFFAHSQITKLFNPDALFNVIGFAHLSRDSKALLTAALAVSIGLTIRAIARKNGSQKTGGGK